ncbi:MAG: MBL fold metallo-hydrolase, partial [Bacteroidales bacterium]
MIYIEKFVFNPFQVNTYLVYDSGNEAYIIDPACSDKSEEKKLTGFIDEKALNLKAIVNTHCHIDHILGVEYIRNKYETEFWCSSEDQFLIDNSVAQGEYFGLSIDKPAKPDRYISEKDFLV